MTVGDFELPSISIVCSIVLVKAYGVSVSLNFDFDFSYLVI